MLARRREALPDGDRWAFEPKWDGFRVLAFRDGEVKHFKTAACARSFMGWRPGKRPQECTLDQVESSRRGGTLKALGLG